jgi:hypothetical protein
MIRHRRTAERLGFSAITAVAVMSLSTQSDGFSAVFDHGI